MVAVTTADVSHLTERILPPRRMMPSNERVETTIEKHEVIELPTQIEIIKDGQPIYGVLPAENTVAFARTTPRVPIPSQYMQPSQEIENLQPPQSDAVPFEMPMRTYLPPVVPETTTTELPITTTDIPTTTTDLITSTTPMVEEEVTTEQPSTLTMTTTEVYTQEPLVETTTLPTPRNQYLPPILPTNHYLPPNQYIPPVMEKTEYLSPTLPQEQYLPPVFTSSSSSVMNQHLNSIISEDISMPKTQYLPPTMTQNQYLPPITSEDYMSENQYLTPAILEERSLPPAVPSVLPENQYLPPTMPENQYLPPVDMMLPPPPPMPQPTYQQYMEQLLQNQQQLYSEDQLLNGMTDVISQGEELHTNAIELQPLQMQPVAPVEPSHSFDDDGYHYKTGEEDLNLYRH